MSPSVARDLVAFIIGSLDNGSPRVRSIVDLSFAVVVTRDEESCFGAVICEHIENVVGVDIRAVIKGYSNSTFNGAVVDSYTTVRNVT